MKSNSKTYLIAEAGVNHNGSLDLAIQLIDAAVDAGADAVKFQTFKTEQVISRFAPKAEYQTKTTGNDESQFDMVKKLELDDESHRQLLNHCQLRGIDFLSTPFDLVSIDLLVNTLGLQQLKIPSGEITNSSLLLKAAQTGCKILLSTGMSNLGDIETALGVIAFGYVNAQVEPSIKAFQDAYCSQSGQTALQDKVTLLHCTTEYPAPFEDVNLLAMDTMSASFGLKVGYSDHTNGISVPIAAVARGASVIEKHFTLDRNLPGPDHKASLEPEELKLMVKSIREVELSLGSTLKVVAQSEMKNKDIARKSLVAACPIRAGEAFTKENLTIKRPGSGQSPMKYWEYIGRIADRDYTEDEVID